jgi:hypothetical protein
MKLFNLIFLLFFSYAFPQNTYPILVKDSIRDAFVDDYADLYVYRNSDNSILKYDSLGKRKAIITLPHPFKILSVENPLNIFLFSENGQDLKILDNNLNEIQTFNFYGDFGHIKSIYVEDLQNIWLIDSSKKSLIYYNYRTDKVNKSFPINMDVNTVEDFIVNNGKIYLLTEKNFSIYNFNSELLFSQDLGLGRKLRRADNNTYIVESNNIFSYNEKQGLKPIFGKENYKIVDKNSTHFLALMYDKFYLYKQEK